MNLDSYEQEILKDFEDGAFEVDPLSDTEKELLRAAAKRTLTMKTRRVNIRLSEVDFQAIQKKAAQEGLPYQTLIASLIHKYTSGLLLDRSSGISVQDGLQGVREDSPFEGSVQDESPAFSEHT